MIHLTRFVKWGIGLAPVEKGARWPAGRRSNLGFKIEQKRKLKSSLDKNEGIYQSMK